MSENSYPMSSSSMLVIGSLPPNFTIFVDDRLGVAPKPVKRTEFSVVICKYCGRNQSFPESGECRGCGASLDFHSR